MRVFISYPPEEHELARRISAALTEDGRCSCCMGPTADSGQRFDLESYSEALDGCDSMIFLITPRAVAEESGSRAALAAAQAKWPHPRGHVLPIVVMPIRMQDIPAYLSSASILYPRADVVGAIISNLPALHRPAWNPSGGELADRALPGEQHRPVLATLVVSLPLLLMAVWLLV